MLHSVAPGFPPCYDASRRREMDSRMLRALVSAASGKEHADFVLKNCRVLNVFSREVTDGDIAVSEGYIAGVGSYRGKEERDARGAYVIPGLIDAHVHIESSLASPEQFASAVIPRGTVSVIADPHELVNVCGNAGLAYLAEALSRTPLRVHMMLPSCVPSTPYETSAVRLGLEETASLIRDDSILGLGEMMACRQVLEGDEETLEKILLAHRAGKPVDGHAPGLTGKDLTAYAAAGILTDHECASPDELKERIARGMHVLLREGSAARNLHALLEGVNEENARWCMFCTDDRQPGDIFSSGHIDNHLRTAVSRGIHPVTAVQMATINAARCYHLRDQGAIAPGYRADFLVTEDLSEFRFREVYIGGRLKAEGNRMLEPAVTGPYDAVSSTVHADPIKPEQLALNIPSGKARVIRFQPGSLITGNEIRMVTCSSSGMFDSSENPGMCKLAVVDRHRRTGNIGIALLENYPISEGAIAMSVAHDTHNIIAAGDRDEYIVQAVNQVISDRGGIALVSCGAVAGTLPLPIAGLMSDQPIEQVRSRLETLMHIAVQELNLPSHIDPILSLSFLALPVIPELKLTDQGLFDSRLFQFVDVEVP